MSKVTGISRSFGAPGKYIQGPGEIQKIKEYANLFGEHTFVLIDSFLFDITKNFLTLLWEDEKDKLTIDCFQGEICDEEINRIMELVSDKEIEVVIGIGGGKTIDTAKVIANQLDAATIIVPTIASTDAPTSAVSVIYHQDGTHSHELFHKKNPDIILMDTSIILSAPSRLLVSGMGDALATYFEARACLESQSANFVGSGYQSTLAGRAIAKTCYETLLKDGLTAKISVEQQIHSTAFENVVEANTLLSGLGFESTGCAGAHGLHDALTTIHETRKYYHGEKVAFGAICQLFLENRPWEEINTVIDFCISVGLPVTLEEIGIRNTSEEHLMPVAIEATKSYLFQAEPVSVTKEAVYGSMILASAFGRQRKESRKRR